MAFELPTSFRYGARAMAGLGAAYPERAVSARQLGEQERVSAKYLEQILRALKAAGLVQAVRGREGGYVLARSPEKITLKELYEGLIGSTSPANCVECAGTCPFSDGCPTRGTWVQLKTAIDGVLERTTVQELVERKRRKSISSPEDFCI